MDESSPMRLNLKINYFFLILSIFGKSSLLFYHLEMKRNDSETRWITSLALVATSMLLIESKSISFVSNAHCTLYSRAIEDLTSTTTEAECKLQTNVQMYSVPITNHAYYTYLSALYLYSFSTRKTTICWCVNYNNYTKNIPSRKLSPSNLEFELNERIKKNMEIIRILSSAVNGRQRNTQ